MKPLTKKPWFGPKRYVGWGLSPRTWQGVVVMLVFVALILLTDVFFLKDLILRLVAVGILFVLFILITILTGGKPGGPKK